MDLLNGASFLDTAQTVVSVLVEYRLMHPFDMSAEEFDPENLEHWLLILGFVFMSIYGVWIVGKKRQSPYTSLQS